jgi:hypothetical protein
MSYYGLDAAFRGVNIDGDRPDFVLIDDPETRESAASLDQIHKRETMVDQDVAGLSALGSNIAIALLTTVQNRYCYSFRVTDPTIKPAFNGRRFALVEKWPDNMEAWQTYIAKRGQAQAAGDKDAVEAVDYYLARRVDRRQRTDCRYRSVSNCKRDARHPSQGNRVRYGGSRHR